jgi:hypothetical protein
MCDVLLPPGVNPIAVKYTVYTIYIYHISSFLGGWGGFPVISLIILVLWMLGHAVPQWLRHCATNRKVAGSIHDGVMGIFR